MRHCRVLFVQSFRRNLRYRIMSHWKKKKYRQRWGGFASGAVCALMLYVATTQLLGEATVGFGWYEKISKKQEKTSQATWACRGRGEGGARPSTHLDIGPAKFMNVVRSEYVSASVPGVAISGMT